MTMTSNPERQNQLALKLYFEDGDCLATQYRRPGNGANRFRDAVRREFSCRTGPSAGVVVIRIGARS